jgi:hypothetical protein
VHAQNLTRVDAIKRDVEGSALAALRGATETLRRDQPALLLELSDRALQSHNATSIDVLSFLAKHSYRVYAFDPNSGSPVPLVPRNYFESENIIALAGDSRPW